LTELTRLHDKVKRTGIENSLPPAITTPERKHSAKALHTSDCFEGRHGEDVLRVAGKNVTSTSQIST